METSDPIDEHHPEVRDRLLATLMAETEDWRSAKGRSTVTEKDRNSLEAALRFSGLTLDGYQLARYLEDSKQWPSDQDLVGILRYTGEHQRRIITQLKRESVQTDDADLEKLIRVGFRFGYKGDSYVVTRISGDVLYLETEGSKFERSVSRNGLIDLIKQNEAIILS